jgi:hypothetical protein
MRSRRCRWHREGDSGTDAEEAGVSERTDGLKYGLGVHALAVAAALEAEGDAETAGTARRFAATCLEARSESRLVPDPFAASPARPGPSALRARRAARRERLAPLPEVDRAL